MHANLHLPREIRQLDNHNNLTYILRHVCEGADGGELCLAILYFCPLRFLVAVPPANFRLNFLKNKF
jgi:hypothetical protein